jgi:hypothetical protein
MVASYNCGDRAARGCDEFLVEPGVTDLLVEQSGFWSGACSCAFAHRSKIKRSSTEGKNEPGYSGETRR